MQSSIAFEAFLITFQTKLCLIISFSKTKGTDYFETLNQAETAIHKDILPTYKLILDMNVFYQFIQLKSLQKIGPGLKILNLFLPTLPVPFFLWANASVVMSTMKSECVITCS